MSDNKKWCNKMAYTACILMIIGVNLTQIFKGATVGDSFVKSWIDGDGVVLLILTILVIMISYCNRKKYIAIPLIFQTGILIYYIIVAVQEKNFAILNIGFIVEVIATILLFMGMFVMKEDKTEHVNDMSTMKVVDIYETEYVDDIVAKDAIWLILIITITITFVLLRIGILTESAHYITSNINDFKCISNLYNS